MGAEVLRSKIGVKNIDVKSFEQHWKLFSETFWSIGFIYDLNLHFRLIKALKKVATIRYRPWKIIMYENFLTDEAKKSAFALNYKTVTSLWSTRWTLAQRCWQWRAKLKTAEQVVLSCMERLKFRPRERISDKFGNMFSLELMDKSLDLCFLCNEVYIWDDLENISKSFRVSKCRVGQVIHVCYAAVANCCACAGFRSSTETYHRLGFVLRCSPLRVIADDGNKPAAGQITDCTPRFIF